MNDSLYKAADLLQHCAEQGMALSLNGQGGLSFQHYGQGDSAPLLVQVKALKSELVDYFHLLGTAPQRVPIRADVQQLLLYRQQIAEQNSAFNIALQFELVGELDFSDFKVWAETLVQRHTRLQSRFVMHKGKLYAQFDPFVAVVVGHHRQKANIDAFRTAPFDLQNGPLYRFDWVETADNKRFVSLVFHHLVFDGHSLQLLVKDVRQYLCQNVASLNLIPATASWLPQVHSNQVDMATYVEHINGFETLDWQQTFGGSSNGSGMALLHREYLSASHFAQLNRLAQKHQMSPFALQSAITALVIGIYSDSRRFLLFTPADRRTSEQHEYIGHFVQMLAIQCELKLGGEVADYLSASRDAFMQAQAHTALSYDNANRWCLSQNHGALPPIKAVIVQQTLPQSVIELAGGKAQLHFLAAETRAVKYPLMLNCQSDGRQLQLEWEYDSSLFSEQHIRQMQQHWLMILELLDSGGACLFDQLSKTLLAKYHHAPLNRLKGSTASVQAHWRNRTITDIWQHSVAQFADRKAAGFGDNWLSYRELNCKANQLAQGLAAMGVTRETKVIISLTRGLDLLCGILAIIKVGGVYVPVDPKAPAKRISHICTDSGAQWVLCDQDWQHGDVNVIDIAKLTAQTQQYEDRAPAVNIEPHDAAYIIYTSGSTGLPKGVVVEHHNLVRLVGAAMNAFDFNADDVWCLFHSFAFDFSVWEIFGPWLTGGAVAIVPDECLLQPALFHRFLLENKVSVLNQTPSAFYNLIDADNQVDEPLSALRYVVFGGEALSLPRLASWQQRYDADRIKLVNMYGITETTVHVTHYTVKAGDCKQARSIIGLPLSDLDVYLLGSDGLPLPEGTKGELYIGGPGVAREYFGKPEMTAQRFVTHTTAGRLYRSGDFARLDNDGQLVYLGRKDDQVKIRGYRIELEEVRQQLMSLDAVKTAVVTVSDIGAGDKLIAFVIPQVAELFVASVIKHELAKRLPPYMIPAICHPIEHIPQTNNGKADIKWLLSEYKRQQQSSSVQNASMLDHPIYAVIANVLGIHSIAADDNLFTLGLDSISCIRLVIDAREQGIHFSVADIYRELTPSRLLALVEKPSSGTEVVVPDQLIYLSNAEQQLAGGEFEMVYPLTRLQQGMCYHSELDATAGVYHDVFGYRLQMHFDVNTLHRVLKDMMVIHPVLRTRLIKGAERLLQGVVANPDVPLQVHDLGGDIELALEQYREFVNIEIANGFDYHDPLLYRLFLHRFDDGSEQLTLSFHHALFDGWSVANFNTELIKRYFFAVEEKPYSILAGNNGHYRDYVFAELAALKDGSHRQFWQALLDGAQVSELPSVARQALPVDAGFTHIPCQSFEQNSDALMAEAKVAGVTVRQLMLAIHLKALSILTHKTRVNTTVVYHNRLDVAGGDVQLGLFLNSLPFDINLTSETWSSVLDQVVTLDRQIMAYRALPTDEIQKLSGLSFQSVLFNYTDFHVYDGLFNEGLPLIDSTVFESVNFPLTIDCGVSVKTRQLRFQVGFDGRQHSQQSVLRYVAVVDALCLHILKQQKLPLPRWQTLFPDERHELEALNKVSIIIEEMALPIDLNAIALMMGERRVSHGELNALVETLVQSLAIERGTRILLHLSKSVEFVVWLLACMRKELVVIPLPVDADPLRQQSIVEHADAAYIVSEQPQTFGYQVISSQDQSDIVLGYKSPLHTPSESAAIVMFTSGTTGKPKGVVLSLHSLQAHSRAMARTLSLTTDDRVLWFASTGADITLEQVIAPLSVGACVVIPEKIWSMAEFLPQVAVSGVTVADLPPVYFQWLMRADAKQKQAWLDSPLRMVLLGGESMPLSVIKAWQQMQLPQKLQLFNVYGPTEATITASVFPISAGFNDVKVSLGMPTEGNGFLVLDLQGKPVPAGVEGILYITGERLANGYLFNEEKTTEAFIEGIDGELMYHTGDIVKWLPDGTLWFVGRSDAQVKIRGYRVELDAVQHFLESREDIHEAVVLYNRIKQRDLLLAFVVASTEVTGVAKRTLASMRSELPHYMVANRIIVVDQIPLTANGKVDSKALILLAENGLETNTTLSGTALKLAVLIAQVLGQTPKSGDESFYDLGGDSLQALQLLSLISARFGVDIALQQLLANSDINGLAELIDQGKSETTDAVVCLSRSDKLPVVLCIPGAGGVAGDFIALASHFPENSVYALQAPGLQFGHIPVSFEQWMDYALQAVKALPRRPVMLVGHSMGGWLGAQLRRRVFGEAKLVLLDSYVKLSEPQNVERFIAEQVYNKLAVMSLDFSLPPRAGLDELLQLLGEQQAHGDTSGVGLWLNLLKLTRAQLKMTPSWGDPLGEMTLINAEHSIVTRGPAGDAWSEFGDVEEIRITGDHFGIVTHPDLPSMLLSVLQSTKELYCR